MDISAEVAAIQAASQGSELRQPLVGALNKLNSGSLPAVTASDAGKILKVGANGWEVGEKSGYMPVPTAAKQITENGTHDVTNYASAVVNVSGGSSVLIPKTITENGTYDPASDNADGYSSVTVNVSGRENPFVLTDYIESSGTQWIDTGYIPSIDTSFEIVATFLSNQPVYSMILGARDTAEGSAGNPVIFGPGAAEFLLGWGSFNLTTGIDSNPFANKKVVCNVNKYGYDVVTEFDRPCGYGNYSGTAPITTKSIYLFSLNANGSEYGTYTRCKARLYRLKIFENNTLVHEYHPFIDSNNIVCLKDIVTSDLKYNSGSGTFTYGTDSVA